ncbi:hypothetical protein B0I35DRAFT_184175 [Stachybotrys elegans]|uniref:Zn(2)-C6 fungal-type domain-containing protein n=1 Tax=Stachybotrys elegans TaxID=80388 RepID=A0A8K0SU31_9HYPO|nr:hypothetical protein B0I35DRAFT_184175 [Stachybotrys elegans]
MDGNIAFAPEMAAGKKRKSSADHPSHSRTMAACDACRVSKTRCDSARPSCGKCAKRGKPCVYPDKDPSTIFESWGARILTAIEEQSRQLTDLTRLAREGQSQTKQSSPAYDEDDLENMSRKDVPRTPITSGEMVLNWAVFPPTKPFNTFPPSAFTAKPNENAQDEILPSPARVFALKRIFIERIQNKAPIVDEDQLDIHIAVAQSESFGWSASSCLVLVVLAIGAIWGNYPDDERRLVPTSDTAAYTVAVPEHRLRESSIYLAMAEKRMAVAYSDDSLVGVVCFCLFGSWYQYTIQPIQGWRMFRTASTLWEAYNMKHAHSDVPRPDREKSLEQRVYWTCLKAECELRHELPDLPPSTLQDSDFPFSLPTFSMSDEVNHDTESPCQSEPAQTQVTPSSYYYFLAEISLRRLLNRTRHAAAGLFATIDSVSAAQVTDTLHQLEDQLQQWLECLPPTLRFNIPPDSWPAPDETELIKLMRERYVEVRELLCRAYLYLCLHGGQRLTQGQMQMYGAEASAGLRLSTYRIRTEKPFYRHAGSWIACRVRFTQALCLIAAARGKDNGVESALYVEVPPDWLECVNMVQERLETWSDQGGELRRWLR